MPIESTIFAHLIYLLSWAAIRKTFNLFELDAVMFFTFETISFVTTENFHEISTTLTLEIRYKRSELRYLSIFIKIFSPKFFFMRVKKISTTAPTTVEQEKNWAKKGKGVVSGTLNFDKTCWIVSRDSESKKLKLKNIFWFIFWSI